MKPSSIILPSIFSFVGVVSCHSEPNADRTSVCAFNGGSDMPSLPSSSSNNGRLVCADFQCRYGRISKGCDTIQCIGTQSCDFSTVEDANMIHCTGENSCHGLNVESAEQVECRGAPSYHACSRAVMANVTAAMCGQNACEYASIRGGQLIHCYGPHSCGSFFEPAAVSLAAKHVECSGETDVCGGASCEGYVSMEAESVVCSGMHACSGATIKASCLHCSGDCSCGGAGIDFPMKGSALCTFLTESDSPEQQECEIGLNGKCRRPVI